jgi:hypothetical protein
MSGYDMAPQGEAEADAWWERRVIGTERRSRWYKRTGRCGAIDPGHGACQQPAPHVVVMGGPWHLEMRRGKVWAEWSGS